MSLPTTTQRRYLIFSGGTLGPWALEHIHEHDVLIGADAGAWFLVEHGYKPHMAMGDFDSVRPDQLARIERESVRFLSCDPVYKDLTDTEMAMVWAIQEGAVDIVLLGVLGTRWDHSLANVHLLRRALQAGVRCLIADADNEIRLIDGSAPLQLHRQPHTHVSLLPLTLEVTGITLEGFMYPLTDAALTIGQSLGVSNVLLGSSGTITIRDGLLLVIRSRDA